MLPIKSILIESLSVDEKNMNLYVNFIKTYQNITYISMRYDNIQSYSYSTIYDILYVLNDNLNTIIKYYIEDNVFFHCGYPVFKEYGESNDIVCVLPSIIKFNDRIIERKEMDLFDVEKYKDNNCITPYIINDHSVLAFSYIGLDIKNVDDNYIVLKNYSNQIIKINIEHDYHSSMIKQDFKINFHKKILEPTQDYIYNKKKKSFDKIKLWTNKNKEEFIYDAEIQKLFIYFLYLQKKNNMKICNLIMCNIITFYTK